jgi:hypothetical protein
MANESVEITQNPNEVTVTQSTNSASVVASNPRAGLGSGGTVQGSLSITQNLDVDGVLETDALTLNGVSLSETIQDVIGAMVASNTETGIAVTYDDTDGTLDFVVASQTDQNFTNADHTKLDGIETGATADQTAAEIRSLVESASDSNVFTDSDHSKLDGIDANADVTINSISAGSNISIDSNGVIAATNTQLTNEAVQDIVGAMVTSNTETGIAVTYDDSDGTLDFVVTSQTENDFTTALKNKLDGIEASATADQTAAEIRTLVESASDSNVFTDADHTKLNSVSSNADVTPSWVPSSDPSYATQSYVGTQISNLVDSAPAALDTLNELAAALGDDANFSTTVTNSIAAKLPLAGGTMTGNIVMSGTETVDGRDLSVDGAKLDGIETGATADQTAAEIRTLVGSASDSNVFTDADHSKLDGISANADVTINSISAGSNISIDSNGVIAATNTQLTNEAVQDIVGAMVTSNTESGITVTYDDTDGTLDFSVASQTDENFTTADHSKLDGIETGATADQTAAEIRTLVDSASDSNVFTDDDHTKLDSIDTNADVTLNSISAGSNISIDSNGVIAATNTQLTNEAVQDIVGNMVSANTETGIEVTYDDTNDKLNFVVTSQTDQNFTNADHTKLDGIETGATADQTAAEIRTLVGSASDSNVFTDADHTKLDGISSGADVTPSWVPSSDPSYATESYVGTQIATVIDSAPAALDTLNELAAAMGDDANFSTTVTNSIATKVPLAGGTMTGHLKFGDSVDARFGASDDLMLGFDGTNATMAITEGDLRFIQYQDNKMIRFYNDNGTGGTVEYLRIDGSAESVAFSRTAHFTDNVKAAFGASHDLTIYHNASLSYIRDEGTGGLHIQTNGPAIYLQDTDGNPMAQFTDGGSCFLMDDGSTKFRTAAGGVEVTGNIVVSGTVDGRDLATDGTKLDGIDANADVTLNSISAGSNISIDSNGVISSTDTQLTTEAVQDIVGAMVSSNTESGIAVTYDDTNDKLNFSVTSQTDQNFTNADHTKLDGIETGATADQTAAEIRTLVGNASDSNVFTDADHSKLDGIEASATADQTAAEIRTLVGSASDSNVFTDADHSKLDGIESGATADQTAAEIRTLVDSASDSNVFTDADHSKLDGIEAGATADQDLSSYATQTYVTTQINNLIDSSPAALDTLNELAAAINDDANFSTTITNSIATKLPLAGGTLTGVLKLPDGAVGAPALSFANDGDSGIYWDNSNSAIRFSIDGVQRGYFSTAGILSQYNVYTGNTGQFRNYGGTWKATTGLTGNGFQFINSVDGTAMTLSSSGDLNVGNDITLGGTVDGRDVATDGTKLDGIESGATADQTAAEIRTLVGSASDSNVFTDADHSKLDGIEASATADQTAAEIRTLVGSASDSNVFTDADHSKLDGIEASATADQTAAEIRTLVGSASDSNVFTDADHSKLDGIEASATADQTASEILTLIKTVDGSGSGLDADTLDGISSASFVRADTNDNTSSSARFTIGYSVSDLDNVGGLVGVTPFRGGFQATNNAGTGNYNTGLEFVFSDSGARGQLVFASNGNNQVPAIYARTEGWTAANGWHDWYKLWHAGNDGSGSGLDADTLDGSHASAFQTALTAGSNITISSGTISATNTTYSVGDGGLTQNNFTDADHSKLDGIEANATADQTAAEIRTLVGSASDSNVFTDADHTKLDGIEANATADQTASEILTLIKTVDGAGSGLDADTIDGLTSGDFIRSGADDSASGDLTFTGFCHFDNDASPSVKITSDDFAEGLEIHRNHASNAPAIKFSNNGGQTGILYVDGGGVMRFRNGTTSNNHKVWHEGNDGSGSGLDADTLDGSHASSFVTTSGDSTISGSLTVDDITINASNISDAGTLYIDAGGDIHLDAAGNDIELLADGTGFGKLRKDGSDNFIIKSVANDKDIKFKGVDNGTEITALTFDMSDGGAANFGGNMSLGTGKSLYMSGTNGLRLLHDGTDGLVINSTGDFKFSNGATDKDIIFKGNDGGSTITALTLDMSAGGDATFANNIIVGGTVDGRDVASDGSKLDGIEAGATADQDLSSYATQTYVNTQISNLVDSSPAALDTLNELAAAINDDANFSTTITNSIATKLPLAGGTLSGNLVMGTNQIKFADDGDIFLGDSNDLHLYHNGSHSYIDNGTTGDLFIRNNGENSVIIGHNANKGLVYVPDGRVELRFNDSKKFETTNDGITVTHDGGTGALIVTDEDTDPNFLFLKSSSSTSQVYAGHEGNTAGATFSGTLAQFAVFGGVSSGQGTQFITGGGSQHVKMTITHDGKIGMGTTSVNSGIGLQVQNGDFYVYNGNIKADNISAGYFASTRDLELVGGSSAGVKLISGSSTILETDSSGASVTGNITVSGTVDGRDVATDGSKLDGIEASADVTDTANVVAALTAGTNITIAGNGTISSADTNTTYSAGSGLDLSSTTFSHSDTSSQSSVNNSNGTVIQDVTLDTYGHVTGLSSLDLDGRYYTESEVANHFKALGVQGNFMNTYAWSGDTSGSADNGWDSFGAAPFNLNDGYSQNGAEAENTRSVETLPNGAKGVVWQTPSNDAQSGADGGWNCVINGVDSTKGYRSVVYFRRTDDSASGTFYHGCHGSHTLNIDGTTNTNPYFKSQAYQTFVQDRWYVSIGYIQPYQSSGATTSGQSGIYDCTTGKKVTSGTDYMMKDGSTIQQHRTYLYYSADTSTSIDFYGPRFEEVNGNEPSTQELVNKGLDGLDAMSFHSKYDPETLSQLTESTDATTDKILLWDESGSEWKYMTLDDLQDSINTDTNTTYSVGDNGLTERNFTSAFKSKLEGIESNATADQTATEILTAIKTVDGGGSGLDADTLDGLQNTSFLRSDADDTVAANITFGDGRYLRLGTGTDTSIYHDSSNTYIDHTGTGNLVFQDSGSTYFYLDGSASNVRYSKDAKFSDAKKAIFGTDEDLQIYHDSGNSFITSATASNLLIQGDTVAIRGRNQENMVVGTVNSHTKLYYDNSERLATSTDGITVGGNGYVDLPDNGRLRLGTNYEFAIYHDGSNSYITNDTTGHIFIQQNLADKDIIFKADDGSGGTTEYFYLDGSAGNILFGKELRLLDGVQIQLGTGNDMQVTHNGATGTIQNATGDLAIKVVGTDADLEFYSDDGSGSPTKYFHLDGGSHLNYFSKTVFLPDNVQFNAGNSHDLQIYHDGTDSYVSNTQNSGDLIIENGGNDHDVVFRCDDGSNGLAEYLRLDGALAHSVASKHIRFEDGVIARFGTGNDASLYHNGTDTIFENTNGDLYFKNHADDKDILFQSDYGDGTVATYFRLDGSFGGAGYPTTLFPNNSSLRFGNSGNLQIINDGTDSFIQENNGDLYIRQSTDNKDIIFQSDDGSGGVTSYFRLDGDSGYTKAHKEIRMDDSTPLRVGTGGDARFMHDGANTYLDNYTGDFYIRQAAADKDIIFKADDGSGGNETYFYLDGSASSGNPVTNFPDNSALTFGNDRDYWIYHDGTDSRISNYVGDLVIRNYADDKDIVFVSDDGSGNTTTYFRLDGSAAPNPRTTFADNSTLQLGDGGDLQIFHDTADSFIRENTRHLYIQNTANDSDIIFQSDDGSGGTETYFSLDGSAAGSFNFTKWPDNAIISVGSSLDAYFYHTGTNTYLENNTGDFYITNGANDKDIIFQCDDSSGGKETYFFLDGSAGSDPITKWPDNSILAMGTSGDYWQYHNGSNTFLANFTGHLYIDSNGTDKDVVIRTDNGSGGLTSYITCDGSATAITLHKGTTVSSGNFEVATGNLSVPYGNITGYYKDFLIEHPTQEGKTLRHGCLEGPEYGAYFRGKSSDSIIECPEYWVGLVEEDSVTVQLTAIGPNQNIYVDHIDADGNIHVGSNTDEPLNYYYMVNGERKGKKIDIVEDA